VRIRRTSFAAGVLGILLPLAAAADALLDVRSAGSRLWIRAESVAPVDLLAAVSAETGIAFDLDEDSANGSVTLDVDGLEVEDALRRLVGALPGASAHSFRYAADRPRRARLVAVRVFGPGRLDRAAAAPLPPAEPTTPPPDPREPRNAEEHLDRMIAAGLSRETAEKVIELNEHARSLQYRAADASVSSDDLSPESRRHLPALLERGLPMDRAVKMLLLQERYHETLAEIRRSRDRGR
jgi:hypothetical protein